jgi:hypothetical protein
MTEEKEKKNKDQSVDEHVDILRKDPLKIEMPVRFVDLKLLMKKLFQIEQKQDGTSPYTELQVEKAPFKTRRPLFKIHLNSVKNSPFYTLYRSRSSFFEALNRRGRDIMLLYFT